MLEDAEKRGGHRKSNVAMKDLRRVINDLALVDVKPNRD